MLDGGFRDTGLEEAFRAELVASSRPTELRLRVLGCVTWAVQAVRAPTTAPAMLSLLALCASASSFLVAWQRPGLPFGPRCLALAAGNFVQMLCGCLCFHSVITDPGTASPFLAAFSVLSGNGVLYLLAFSKLTPLPFRWQLPLLGAMAAALLAHRADFCANEQLQHGYAMLHAAATALPMLLVPGALQEPPPRGLLAATLARGDGAAAGALCRGYQAGAALLGCAAIAAHLYSSETARRRTFLARRQAQAAEVAGSARAATSD